MSIKGLFSQGDEVPETENKYNSRPIDKSNSDSLSSDALAYLAKLKEGDVEQPKITPTQPLNQKSDDIYKEQKESADKLANDALVELSKIKETKDVQETVPVAPKETSKEEPEYKLAEPARPDITQEPIEIQRPEKIPEEKIETTPVTQQKIVPESVEEKEKPVTQTPQIEERKVDLTQMISAIDSLKESNNENFNKLYDVNVAMALTLNQIADLLGTQEEVEDFPV